MTLGRTALSALRKAGSAIALQEIQDTHFPNGPERDAFIWLRGYVAQYRNFPTPLTFQRETGIATVVTNESLTYYLDRLNDRALFNTVTPLAARLTDALRDNKPRDAVAICREIIRAESQVLGARESGVVRLSDAMDLVLADHEEAQFGASVRGLPTGWPEIDEATGGWQRSDLITWVARPGAGKTYLLLKQALAAWRAGHSILFASQEMQALPLARRLLGIDHGVNPDFIKRGRLSTFVRNDVVTHVEEMKTAENETPFIFAIGSFRKSVESIRALCDEVRPDGIYIDASYLLKPSDSKWVKAKHEVVGDVVEALKLIAIDFQRPVIQTVQFNREADRDSHNARPRPRPRTNGQEPEQEEYRNPIGHLSLAKIGKSDDIGQASSVVVGIEKHQQQPTEKRYVGLLKGREGEDESAVWVLNYLFSPSVNFDIIARADRESVARNNQAAREAGFGYVQT